jgi:hypothetical protein
MKGSFMRNPAEALTEMGVPNNILTRTAYRATYKLVYTALYTILMVAAVITRKDKLEIVNSVLVKLGIEPVTAD